MVAHTQHPQQAMWSSSSVGGSAAEISRDQQFLMSL
jgi:hypothetical protein